MFLEIRIQSRVHLNKKFLRKYYILTLILPPPRSPLIKIWVDGCRQDGDWTTGSRVKDDLFVALPSQLPRAVQIDFGPLEDAEAFAVLGQDFVHFVAIRLVVAVLLHGTERALPKQEIEIIRSIDLNEKMDDVCAGSPAVELRLLGHVAQRWVETAYVVVFLARIAVDQQMRVGLLGTHRAARTREWRENRPHWMAVR